jgi:hypothetical protein
MVEGEVGSRCQQCAVVHSSSGFEFEYSSATNIRMFGLCFELYMLKLIAIRELRGLMTTLSL